MISVTSNPVKTSVSLEHFLYHFQDIKKVAKIFNCKPVRHLAVEDSKLSFILKRVAQFEFTHSKDLNETWIQFDSTSAMMFKSAIRFTYREELKDIIVDFETDTNVFMELFLESRMQKLLNHLTNNINDQLN